MASKTPWNLDDAAGNVSHEIKQKFQDVTTRFLHEGDFGFSILKRITVKEMSFFEREEDGRLQARMVFETTVAEDMVNGGNTLHGACSALLIDCFTTLSLSLLEITQKNFTFHVSQSLNTVFHAAAPLGSKIEIVNTTTSMGGRVMTARSEIWDVTHRRLVASGVHIKIAPSVRPKL